MENMTEYKSAAEHLDHLFDLLNARYFENALSKPIITIQSTPKVFGHVTVDEIWKAGEEKRHELNIGAETISRPIANVAATMIHEMVHLYNMANQIKDTSRGGTYHNKAFKREAEARDLIITYNERIGWSVTQPTDALKEWCTQQDLAPIRITRLFQEKITKKKTSTRKYVCPCCDQSIRATKDVNLICGACYEKTGMIIHLEKED